jgi:hypothetical protein
MYSRLNDAGENSLIERARKEKCLDIKFDFIFQGVHRETGKSKVRFRH